MFKAVNKRYNTGHRPPAIRANTGFAPAPLWLRHFFFAQFRCKVRAAMEKSPLIPLFQRGKRIGKILNLWTVFNSEAKTYAHINRHAGIISLEIYLCSYLLHLDWQSIYFCFFNLNGMNVKQKIDFFMLSSENLQNRCQVYPGYRIRPCNREHRTRPSTRRPSKLLILHLKPA